MTFWGHQTRHNPRQPTGGLPRIFAADLILRWAYQMGKTPLLPLFAAMLGAAELMTGLIISVSTFTGMILKPLFGLLSDRFGRRIWLLVALVLFTILPFFYRFISTPEQLLALRLVHGLATAIFGPVSLALVAEIHGRNLAGRLAVFGMARSIAAMGAPLTAGLALSMFEIQTVFSIMGFLSLTAALPLFTLNSPKIARKPQHRRLWDQTKQAFHTSLAAPSIWLAGGLELMVYLATYATRAFLPLFILSQPTGTILQAGLFFTLQEAAHIILRPFGGALADQKGLRPAILFGLSLLALSLVALSVLPNATVLAAALLMGAAQAFILPASTAVVATGSDGAHPGAAMGIYGALRNIGKVLGPIVAGILLTQYSFSAVFMGFAALTTVIFVVLALRRT